jgi:hypothetical protein
MGKIQLSALVTNITGSIGGTTFRRTPRGTIAYNKQSRLITNAITSNVQRLNIGTIFSNWSRVDKNIQDQWKNVALQVPFVDKFGKNVFLTGRQLYTKCVSQGLVYPGISPNPFSFSTEVANPIISSVTASATNDEVTLFFEENFVLTKVTVGIKPKIRTGSVQPHAHYKVVGTALLNNTNEWNIGPIISELYDDVYAGRVYEVHVYAVNNSGITSPVTAIDFVVTS